MISAVALAAAVWLAAVGFLTAGLSRSPLRIAWGCSPFRLVLLCCTSISMPAWW